MSVSTEAAIARTSMPGRIGQALAVVTSRNIAAHWISYQDGAVAAKIELLANLDMLADHPWNEADPAGLLATVWTAQYAGWH